MPWIHLFVFIRRGLENQASSIYLINKNVFLFLTLEFYLFTNYVVERRKILD